MSEWQDIIRRVKCWFQWCGGYVVSGTHDREIWVGWRCVACGQVKHYEPATRQFQPLPPPPEDEE